MHRLRATPVFPERRSGDRRMHGFPNARRNRSQLAHEVNRGLPVFEPLKRLYPGIVFTDRWVSRQVDSGQPNSAPMRVVALGRLRAPSRLCLDLSENISIGFAPIRLCIYLMV